MMRKLVAPLAFGLVAGSLALVAASGIAVGSRDQSPEKPIAVAPAPDSKPFDPAVVALGVTTKESLAVLSARQQQLAVAAGERASTALSQRRPTPVGGATPAQTRFGEAIDRLYSKVAADPRSEALRQAWRACMAAADLPYANPVDLEAWIAESQAAGDDIDLARIVASRDACDAQDALRIAPLLRGAFPAWKDANAQVIADYKNELGLKT